MAGRDTPLGIIPMGTASVLAAELGLPSRPEAVAAVIAGGTPRALHVPRANGLPFLLMAGVGFDGAVVEAVTPSLKRRFSKGAFVLQALRVLATDRRPRMRVEVDGALRTAEWVVVTNVSRYAGPYLLAPGADPESQELAVCLFDRVSPLALTGHLVRLVHGGAMRAPGAEMVRAREIVVSAPARVPVQIDGDAAGELPLRIQSTCERVRVLCP